MIQIMKNILIDRDMNIKNKKFIFRTLLMFSASFVCLNASAQVNTSEAQLQLQTNGTTRVVVDSTTGNVGIGTTAPTANLHIEGASGAPAVVRVYSEDDQQSGVNVGTGPTNRWAIGQNTAAAGRNFYIYGNHTGVGGTEGTRFVLTPESKFGFNKSSPTYDVDVSGTVAADYFVGDGSGLTGLVASMGIDDLTDAKHDTDDYSSLFLGNSAGANDDGTSNENVGVGLYALSSNTSGINNTAVGNFTLPYNTTGGFNAALGRAALFTNTTGTHNTALGNSALAFNTTGSANTASGVSSGSYMTSGNNNVFMGYQSALGVSGTTVLNQNVIIGHRAGYALETADDNTFIGNEAGDAVTTGDRNILIGSGVDTSAPTASDELNIGNVIYGNLANGNVGIGTNAPTFALDVSGSARIIAEGGLSNPPLTVQSDSISMIDVVAYGLEENSNYGGAIRLHGAAGSAASPLATPVGSYIGGMVFVPHGGTNFLSGSAGMLARATENITSSARGTKIEFTTTETGTTTYSTKMTIADNGYVGIGTESPQNKIHTIGARIAGNGIRFENSDTTNSWVVGASTSPDGLVIYDVDATESRVVVHDNGNVGIGTVNPSVKLEINGDARAAAFITSSDRAFKENIQPLEQSLNKILELQGVSYVFKQDLDKNFPKEPQIGLIAQDVERVYPEFVKGEEGDKSVNYAAIVAPLIEAVKEQQAQIEALKIEVEALKAGR